MRGVFYAISEILIFLVIATVIGFFIGRWYASIRSDRGTAEATTVRATPAPSSPQQSATESELASALSLSEEMEKELSLARWQISTLEDELSKRSEAEK